MAGTSPRNAEEEDILNAEGMYVCNECGTEHKSNKELLLHTTLEIMVLRVWRASV